MARGNRGIKLPDAGEVPQIGIASDPGLRVPDTGGPIGDALVTAGNAVTEVAYAKQRAAERQQRLDDAVASGKAMLDYQKSGVEEFQRRQTEDDPSRPDFIDDFDQFLDTRAQDVLANLPEGMSEEARAELTLKLGNQRLGFWESAGRLHLGAVQDQALGNLAEQTNIWAAQASRDPLALDDVLAVADAELDMYAGALPGDKEQAARAVARSTIIESAVSGLIDKGRLGEARAILADERFDADIDAGRRQVMGNRIEAEQKALEVEARQRAAEAKALYLTGYEDYTAYLRSGGVPDGRYSRDEMMKVVGGDQGARLAADVERAAAFGETYRSVEFATPEELTAMLAKEQGDLSSPTDFRTERSELTTLAQAVEARNNRLIADPAAFVLDARPVRAAYDAMTAVLSNPQATQEAKTKASLAYATASETEQARLGLPPEAQRLLTEPYADQIAAQFNRQGEGGENAATLVSALAAQWGSKWPQVYSELGKKLPSSAVVIGAGMSPGPAAMLAEGSKPETAEKIKKALPSDTLKEIDEAVVIQLAGAASTLLGQPGGLETYGIWRENTAILAQQRVLMNGESPTAAAEWAANETFNKNYTITGTYRVPIGIDADEVDQGLNHVMGRLLVDLKDQIDVPESLIGVDQATALEQYRKAIVNKGYWVTAPDESGLVLYDETRSAVTVNGEPYTVTWGDLLDRSDKPALGVDTNTGQIIRVPQ